MRGIEILFLRPLTHISWVLIVAENSQAFGRDSDKIVAIEKTFDAISLLLTQKTFDPLEAVVRLGKSGFSEIEPIERIFRIIRIVPVAQWTE